MSLLDPLPQTKICSSMIRVGRFSCIFFGFLLAFYASLSQPPYDFTKHVIGRDFINVWVGSKIALSGQVDVLFDWSRYMEEIRSYTHHDYRDHNWGHPLHFLLLILPLGRLPYWATYLIWTVGGVASFVAALLFATRRLPEWRMPLILFSLGSAAAFINLLAGQTGFFTAALLIGALAARRDSPVLSGVLLALLTIKPQLGILIPLLLIVEKRWLVIATTVLVTAVLIAASSLVFGLEAWYLYLTETARFQTRVLTNGYGLMLSMMPTPYVGARLIGLSSEAAWFVHLPIAVSAISICLWGMLRHRDNPLGELLVLTGTFLVSPYGFSYDLTILSVGLLWFIRAPDTNRIDFWLVIAVSLLPIAMVVLGLWVQVPLGSLMLALLLGRVVLRMQRSKLQGNTGQQAGRQLNADTANSDRTVYGIRPGVV